MTKIPEQVIVDQLENDPDVAALLAGRIYPVIAPASAALPFATWRRQNVTREMTLSGPLGVPTVSLAVDIYAESYAAVRDIADRVRAALNGFSGSVGNWISVEIVSLQSESDGFVQLSGGDLPPVYSVTQTYSVLWQSE
jgi:hypothetical protein